MKVPLLLTSSLMLLGHSDLYGNNLKNCIFGAARGFVNFNQEWSSPWRRTHLITQGEGNCGPTCVININQAVRSKLGLSPLKDPTGILENITHGRTLEQGTTPVDNLILLKTLLEYIPINKRPSVSGVILQSIPSEYRPNFTPVQKLTTLDLTPTAKRYIIVFEKQVLGDQSSQHAVI